MNLKKILKNTFRGLGVCGLIVAGWSCYAFGAFVNSARSVKQLSEHIYYMEFSGDYQLKEMLELGGADSNDKMAVYIEKILKGKRINKVFKNKVPLDTGCAAISAFAPDGKKVFGRNYDWDNLTAAMIIKSNPKNGYKSISTTQLDFLGFGEGYKPDSFANCYMAAAGLFVPLDGMNEKGLCVSDLMAGDKEQTNQDTGKSDVTTTLAIRGMLDFCQDVPEAIEFLKNYDMHSVIGSAHHFAISDASGRSVVVEYVNNEMIVTETNAVTNHYLGVKKDTAGRENSIERLGLLQQRLAEKTKMTESDVKQALYDIRASQYGIGDKTWWRAVFNQNDLTVTYSLEENYDASKEFVFKF